MQNRKQEFVPPVKGYFFNGLESRKLSDTRSEMAWRESKHQLKRQKWLKEAHAMGNGDSTSQGPENQIQTSKKAACSCM